MVSMVTEVASWSWFRSKGGTLGRALVGFMGQVRWNDKETVEGNGRGKRMGKK